MKKSDKKEIENMNIKISEKPTEFNMIEIGRASCRERV